MSIIDVIRYLEIKTMIKEDNFVSVNMGIVMLRHKLEYQLIIEDLEKQLSHAINTGGEYLEIHKQIH